MILKIVIAPDSILRQESEPVNIDNEQDLKMMQSFFDSLVETCHCIKGLGLSAVQVGVGKRLFIVTTEEETLHFVNPEIIETSDSLITMREGCLSFPGIFADVERPSFVKIKYHDYNMELQELTAGGIIGRCILHEYDHLKGKLFSDMLGTVSKDMVLRKSRGVKKELQQRLNRQNVLGKQLG
jgi:peptide deformylase